jgi:DNA phosphorothioation-dependent restriction protein DptG
MKTPLYDNLQIWLQKATAHYSSKEIIAEATEMFINARIDMRTKEIRKAVIKIIQESKPTFFVKDKNVKIPSDELLYEQKAEICTNVEMYFNKLLT